MVQRAGGGAGPTEGARPDEAGHSSLLASESAWPRDPAARSPQQKPCPPPCVTA